MNSVHAKVLQDQRDLLLLRPFRPDLKDHASIYLAWGMGITWLAGIGRYWDHPNASTWQYLGLGSVVYVLVLAAILYVVVMPLRPANWSYRTVLVFVTLTSLPALLYAIPVEKFMALSAAQTANVLFLAVVATWRVIMLLLFLRRAAGLSRAEVAVTGLLPLALIVTSLVVLNLERAVFDIMGGLREQTSNDSAYAVLWLISLMSVLASPVLLVAYLVLIARRRRVSQT